MIRKGANPHLWSTEAEEAFRSIKQAFASAPILHRPVANKPFILEVDASAIGAGAVLSQKSSSGRLVPCGFFSKIFSSSEKNYSIGDKELLAIRLALEEWRYLLEGALHRFIIYSDHKNLAYIRSAQRLNPRQARWALFFARFDFELRFLPGNKNSKADALSRSFQVVDLEDEPAHIIDPARVITVAPVSLTSLPPDIRVLQDTAVDMDIQALCSSMDNLVVNVQKIQDTIDQKSMLEPRIPIPDLFFGDRTKFLSFRTTIALGLLYDEPNSVDQAEKNLLALCQGQDDVEVYCQKCRKWSVLTPWNESALAALFRKGLSEALKDVMVGFPMPAGLNESMSLAIQIGRRLRERKSVHHLAVLSESKPEPMRCDRAMTKVERQEHRRLNRLCFYCGDSTHAISNCPKRTRRFDSSAVIGTVQSKFLLSITLMCSLSSYSVMAFVDSGAALNLMDLDYAKRCGFFLEPLRCPIPLRGIDATPLAKNKPQYWAQLTMCMAPAHQEVIRFLVLHNLHDVVVLGLPWLQTHNPVLDWNSMSVTSWGCQGVHGDVPFLSISSSIPSDIPEFLSDFQDVFEESKSDALPPHRNCDCAIDLIPGSKFPKGRLFNLSVPEHTAMRSYVKESLEKGHIRPSSSPLGAGFFFVAKKDGSLRPCIDYRLLNKITVKFQYPLPLISDLFARIKGASWFTKIDLRGAYNLVRIRQGDEWKTAFNTPEGHFEYLVMPFGLANVPSVFQSFMHDIFREYLDKFLIVYLDDILIFSDDWESHVKQVRMVFQVLRANSLFVKGSKCLFGVQKVSFLGFIFSPSTIEMDPVKVQAIQDWTQPTSLKSLQKFLGFANFYRRFICNFSSIARPLTDLTKKGADLVNWSFAAVEAFQELKRRFCCAPVLCQPDVSLPFQVEVDASEIGAGAVLSQRGSGCSVFKPCAFFSRKFSAAERNYDVGNRELLAMKWAFEEWRHWLEGAKHRVVVLTDHKNLTYLESAKRLNPRQARWSLFFARFDFVISYLPGSKNVKADALSRSFVPDSPGLSEPASILKEGVIVSAISPDLRRVLQKFQANKPDRCPAEKLFVPDRWTSKFISELHCSVLAGHPGIFGTRELVARSFWWPSLSRDHVVRLHGIPENIVSDRGSQFVSRFWRAFCGRMGIDLSFSSAFHPQTNGQTERTNQTLETYLRCFVSADQDDWVSFLPLAEFALNNRASSATLVSPFFCNSGFHPRFSSGQVESSDCPGVDSVVDRLQQIWTQVVDNLTLSQEKAQLFANRRRRVGPRLRVGDLVWLSSRHIPMKVSSPKFKPRFIGPYRISEILNPVSFRLILPDSFSIHNVFHRSLLRRYVAPMVPSVEPPAPVLVEGELEYIVEKILDSRVSRRKLQYLVKWKGYAQEDNSWVFASDVHAPDLVRAFHVAHPGRPGGSGLDHMLIEKSPLLWDTSQDDTINNGILQNSTGTQSAGSTIWDVELERSAEAWAETCLWEHGPANLLPSIGQNLGAHWGRFRPPTYHVQAWYDEVRDYTFPYPQECNPYCPFRCSGPVCTHYTQVVWATSSRIGCAINLCHNMNVWGQIWPKAIYLVCNYSPKGNWWGHAPYKHGRSCSACPPSYGGGCRNNLCFRDGSDFHYPIPEPEEETNEIERQRTKALDTTSQSRARTHSPTSSTRTASYDNNEVISTEQIFATKPERIPSNRKISLILNEWGKISNINTSQIVSCEVRLRDQCKGTTCN
ncbi:unnamed protein product, partial [Ranitomeya imitator]